MTQRALFVFSAILLLLGACADTQQDSGPAPLDVPDIGQPFDTDGPEDTADPTPDADPDPNPSPQPDVSDNEDIGRDVPGPEEDADDACVAFNVLAQNALLPVDIVWIIDASPSMIEEITIIEENLNLFAERIGASSLDYRVIIIGSDSDYCDDGHCFLPICVPAPLSGAPGCPDIDSERYLHVRDGVHSRDGLDVAIANADTWLAFLRPAALTHFVMVTDDNSGFGADADDFTAFMQTHNETIGQVRFHSIVDLVGYEPNCVFDDNCSCGEERGQTYIDLSERTGGLVQSVCEEDWDPIFETLEERVREGTELPCTFRIPDPGDDRVIDPDEINVVFLSEDRSQRALIPQVPTAEDCLRAPGWYYDDPIEPTLIHLCPDVCAMDADIVEVEIGCRTVKN